MNTQKIFCLISFVLLAGMVAGQPGTRIKLTQLEQAPNIDGSRKGMIGLSNAAGDQRYAFYVNVADTCISYTPTDTGNTTVSIFVQKCATDSIWYIDYEGRSILLAPYGAGSDTCDVDWLQISDASCPDAITDSIFKYKYASVGARYVWPGAEFLVTDSTASAIEVVQGSRNARTAWYDSQGGTFSMMDHGGSTPTFYIPVGANMIWKTTAGTPQTPVGSQVNHLAINSQDSTIQIHQYPYTRIDTQAVHNFLYTDDIGKIRTQPSDSFPQLNLYTIDGTIYAPGSFRTATIPDTTNGLSFQTTNGGQLYITSNGIIGMDANTGSSIILQNQSTQLAVSNGLMEINALFIIRDGNELRFDEPLPGTNFSEFKAGAQSSDITYTLPLADVAGTLASDGSGNLSWTNAVNVYNSNGNFPPDNTRLANLDSASNVLFNYPSGTRILELSGGSDSSALNGHISFFSPDELNQITLNDSGIESLWSNDQSFSVRSQDSQNSIIQDTFGLNIVGIDDATNAYTIAAQKAGPVTMRAQQQNADRIADIILDLNVGNTPISLLRAYDISASITLNEVRIDTSGVGINTRGGVGDEGDILQSNGAKTFWGGDGTFNADQLSFMPNGTGGIDQWIAVTANRYNSSIFPSGTSTPSESVTEILVDTSATTSTVNLNYTPDNRYTSTFTTVRYLYNFGSGNMTVQTNQSWQFKTTAGSATTLTIASGENYKLIWKEGATAADSRFYAVKLQ